MKQIFETHYQTFKTRVYGKLADAFDNLEYRHKNQPYNLDKIDMLDKSMLLRAYYTCSADMFMDACATPGIMPFILSVFDVETSDINHNIMLKNQALEVLWREHGKHVQGLFNEYLEEKACLSANEEPECDYDYVALSRRFKEAA